MDLPGPTGIGKGKGCAKFQVSAMMRISRPEKRARGSFPADPAHVHVAKHDWFVATASTASQSQLSRRSLVCCCMSLESHEQRRYRVVFYVKPEKPAIACYLSWYSSWPEQFRRVGSQPATSAQSSKHPTGQLSIQSDTINCLFTSCT